MSPGYGTSDELLADRYQLDGELGAGAMGTVYRARDVRLGRPVAIKMLHPMLTNEIGILRFQSEIRIAAGLRHPNIVGVHESGEVDGQLYYVMDYLGGETLRSRLQREKQLSVEECLRIVSEVSAGLQHAHDSGIVHRDVKPENIILADGRACLVDFGLAKAIRDVDASRLTASGLSVGTPHYLSPEQAAAERDVGPAADQYALACVMFEMLVGEPPFTGPTATSVAMRHITESAPRVRPRRPTATPGIDAAAARAMEKVPADRFSTVTQFADACRTSLAATSVNLPPTTSRRWRPSLLVPAALATVLLLLAFTQNGTSSALMDDGVRLLTGRVLDSSQIVVLPFTGPDVLGFDGPASLTAALARWDGIKAQVPESQPRNDVATQASVGATIARKQSAGSYVTTVVSVVGESVHVRSQFFDTRRKALRRTSALAFLRSQLASNGDMVPLAAGLLFDGLNAERDATAARATAHRAAFAALLRGRSELMQWELTRAESSFARAAKLDPTLPQASLGLAQAKVWARDRTSELDELLGRAVDGGARMNDAERAHATALRYLNGRRYPDACAAFDGLIARDSLDYAAWLGRSECHRRDNTAVPDARSRSGLVFRGSVHSAFLALNRAFELLPRIHASAEPRRDSLFKRLLFTGSAQLRLGRQAGGGGVAGYPEWNGDTLAFAPYPDRLAFAAAAGTIASSHAFAVEKQRLALHQLAARRLATEPRTANALEAMAEAMELLGDGKSLDTIRAARLIATDPSQRLRLAVTENWLRLKGAIPRDIRELQSIRISAESLLATAPVRTPQDAGLLAGMAALIGNADRASALLVRNSDLQEFPFPVPRDVFAAAAALMAHAALGGPPDSLNALEERVSSGIRNGVVPDRQREVTENLLGRAATIAYPTHRLRILAQADSSADYLLRAEAMHGRGRQGRVREILGDVRAGRVALRPGDLTFDTLFPESWLLASIGDSTRALTAVRETLDALPLVTSSQFRDFANAGSLFEAMLLRADLERRHGKDVAAREWARAVEVLSDTGAGQGRLRANRARSIGARTR